MEQVRLAGHSLPSEGRVWDGPSRISKGHAVCTCGATSDQPLPSDRARRAWHQDHKSAVQAAKIEGDQR